MRQTFISYRRTDSRRVAEDLFNELSQRKYTVFLDTASVESAVPFQDALWDRLADMDLLVLLDSPNALTSRWVNDELVQVNNLGLGGPAAHLAGAQAIRRDAIEYSDAAGPLRFRGR